MIELKKIKTYGVLYAPEQVAAITTHKATIWKKEKDKFWKIDQSLYSGTDTKWKHSLGKFVFKCHRKLLQFKFTYSFERIHFELKLLEVELLECKCVSNLKSGLVFILEDGPR